MDPSGLCSRVTYALPGELDQWSDAVVKFRREENAREHDLGRLLINANGDRSVVVGLKYRLHESYSSSLRM